VVVSFLLLVVGRNTKEIAKEIAKDTTA